MFANMTSGLDFHSKALVLRAERQRLIAGNIANADTPGFAARDIDFKEAMANATGSQSQGSLRPLASPTGAGTSTSTRHIPLGGISDSGMSGPNALAYTVQSQPSMDGNSVELDRERASFVDNSVRYEATLRFINGSARTLLSAIQGQ